MKIDIFSGFLGAGKTTLIKKLLKEAYVGEKVVLIENEFGEIGIDGGFLQEAGVNITEMNSGCICCSLVGDFSKALQQVARDYAPDRILIEPSGVGKLSDVVKAVKNAAVEGAILNAACVVVDAAKCKMYMKNFGEFFLDQVKNAGCIVLSHTAKVTPEKLHECVRLLKESNEKATMVTANWDDLSGKTILAAIEKTESLEKELCDLAHEMKHHHHHDHAEECTCGCHDHHHHEREHHHHDHGEECTCGCHDHHHHEHEHHHHDHSEECTCGCHEHHHDHEHHHHDHGEECTCGCHDHHHEHEHHRHDHGEECACGCHDHHHHEHHHHADEVFVSWGVETVRQFTVQEIEAALSKLVDEEKYGVVLRAKGIVAGAEKWVHFDYVPGEADVREGGASVVGRLCVIGCNLCEEALKQLFNV